MALERGSMGEMVLYNPMVVPLTMARHGIAGESIGIPWAGILGSIGFGIGSLEVIFSTDTKQGR